MASPLSRRSFLAAGAGALMVAACGGDDTSDTSTTESQPPYVLGKFFPDAALIGTGPQRMPMGIFNFEGALADDPPPELTFTVEKEGGEPGPPMTVKVHDEGLARGYYPVVFTPQGVGVYVIRTNVKGTPVERTVQFNEKSTVRQPGQPLAPVDTPTVADRRGVELLCTRTPECPLHDVTLREALTSGQHVAFLIATPAFCQTAVCGPVLDVMLGVTAQFPQVKFLHSEVYPTKADAQASDGKLVEAVSAQGLSFEPVLFLTNTDGTIAQRFDTIFDASELRDALTELVA